MLQPDKVRAWVSFSGLIRYFRTVIMAKNIKMADVPLYMRRKTIARREERKKANSTYSSALFNKLQGTNVTIDRSKLDGILLQYTS